MKPVVVASDLVVLLAVAAAVVWALSASTGDILVKDVVASPVPGAERTLRVFLKIENSGGADVLLAASSPDAGRTEVFSPEVKG